MFFNNNLFGQKCCNMNNNCFKDNCDCPCDPIIEKPIQRCIENNICHKVEHICPIHTTVVNNHIYEHTYTPEYTYSEENTVTNIDPGCCGNF